MNSTKKAIYNLISIIYLVVVFLLSCVIFSRNLNQGNVDMTTTMQEATLPVLHLNVGDMKVNYLYGYTGTMETAYMRDTLTVVDSERKLDFGIDTYGTDVENMLFEVRSIDGSRLVESTDINIYSKQNDEINGTIIVKDLITNGDEYVLIFILTLKDGREVRYYTRLIWKEDLHVDEKLGFIVDFSDRTFDKEAAKELSKYLETNATGDNSTYEHVDIHSNFNQVTWGDLRLRRVGEPRVTISELTSATGYFKVEYQIEVQEESGWALCNVIEYYRIRYTTDRIYLLSWERFCNQIPDETADIYSADQIELGIVSQDIEIKECDGGNHFAFVDQGKLIGVDATQHKVGLLFSFLDTDGAKNIDLRLLNQDHDIHILNIDEAGNVIFIVYGYMNRGLHEGHVGVVVYEYNSSMNTVEELAYVNYSKAAGILRESISELSYAGRDDDVYFMLERNVYKIDLKNEKLDVVAENMADGAYKVSDGGKLLVWQGDGEDIYSCTRLRLMNLSSGISEDVKAGYGECILPLGFMNTDLVYGLARSKDITQDHDGSMIFPMYKIIIRNADGDILKEYGEDGIYVMDCQFSDGLFNMTRAKYDEGTGRFEPTSDDQIVSTEEKLAKENNIKPVVTEALETVMQISMKDEMESDNILYLTPKMIIYEGDRELSREESNDIEMYYVYGLHGFMHSYLNVGNAVNKAYEISGIVMNDVGQYVWYKSNRVSKNQIMAITEPESADKENSLASCVDAILRFEGITTNSRILLSQGQSVADILREYLGENKVLNLNGCNLDTVLYYVNLDIPVLAVLNDGSAVLITGFNDNQIVLYDPSVGDLHKENITDMDNLFRASGYKFITYIK